MQSKRTFRGVVLRDKAPRGVATPDTGDPRIARGAARVRVGRELAGRGGRGVSVISGLPLGEAQLAELARRLKKLCGAGGTVRGGIIEIQGDHRDLLVSELCKLGFAARRSGG